MDLIDFMHLYAMIFIYFDHVLVFIGSLMVSWCSTPDAVVFFTALGGASGYGGHTGGAYDMMPEVCILDAFYRACPERFALRRFSWWVGDDRPCALAWRRALLGDLWYRPRPMTGRIRPRQ